ncbi:MAG: methionine--tRNA ligase [Candidatus Shikimatogenerans bostrichidophilus]|nr:MAG: methionine--tRNA ligase [Candidatus Shikimatogenerans bostrichidophilus]
MNKNKKYIVTAAFPYTNGNLHIGHVAGVFLPADIYSRYLRSINKKLIFISGSDEHGASILIKSIKENISPRKIINKYHKNIKEDLKILKISIDNYYRTSDKLHHKYSKKVFSKLYKKNFFEEKTTYQYYDKKYKLYLADRFVIGICPNCNYKFSYSDQCEKCGNILNVGDLINPKSILTNNTPILKKTINLFISFKSKKEMIYKILKYFKKKKINNKIIKIIYNFIKTGLQDRSITRDLEWGIKLPNIKKEYKFKVLYVWFEAILGYITSTIDWANKNKKKWQSYWKNKRTKLINFIGKDNIIFHSIFFPIIIKNYNKKYIIPYYINSNEFLNLEGKKISTSKNWAIFIKTFFKYFPNLIDSLRYSLIMDMPINKDSNFTWEKFKFYHNSELIGILANFFNRVIVLIHKFCNGYIPNKILLKKKDKLILNKIYKYPKKIGNLIYTYDFRKALYKYINLARIGNKYLSKNSPWTINDVIKRNTILYVSSQIIGYISHLSYIFIPYTTKKFLKILNIKLLKIIKLKKNVLSFNHKINKPKIIFRKLTNEEINYQKKILNKLKI